MYLQCMFYCEAAVVWRDNSPYCRVWGTGIWGRLFSSFHFDASGFALINTKTMNWFNKGIKAKVKSVLLLKDTRGLSCRNDTNCSRAIHVQFCSMEKCIWWSKTLLPQELFHRCFKALLSKARCTFSSHIAVFSVKNFTYISICQSFSHLLNSSFVCRANSFSFSHCKASELLRRIAFDETNL